MPGRAELCRVPRQEKSLPALSLPEVSTVGSSPDCLADLLASARCLAVGMLKEDVRQDRTRGGRKRCRRTTEGDFQSMIERLTKAGDSAAASESDPNPVPMETTAVDEVEVLRLSVGSQSLVDSLLE